jgi:hypothetical protein
MLRAIVRHARHHSIAYVALTCALLALGGAAYAAIRLPPGSVGERQLQNHVIDPVKWDTNYVTGFVRRWATINANGGIASTSPGGQSTRTATGNVVVTWGDAFAGWCAPEATVIGGSATRPSPGTAKARAAADTTGPTGPAGPTGPTGPAGPPGPSAPLTSGAYANAKIFPRSGQSTLVGVATYNSQGQPANVPVSVAIICGPGAGSGQSFPTNLP